MKAEPNFNLLGSHALYSFSTDLR
uniref:Uncharacterized protein n=1 Tax=Arundo donax TaxID=35708 RepID=A0A0A9HRD6_ARUDO